MHDLKLKAAETARFLRARVAPLPRIAVLAGTGLGGLGNGLRVATALPYADIPHFPLATVQETIAAVHAGMRVLGVSIITNVNDPDHPEPAALEDIIAVAARTAPSLTALLADVLRRSR